ncbi:MAG TPA: 1,4-alpha-glucan branching protein GlgB [Bacteroidota bacterium]|nr:1,4-alpha-glucan branching protein GlgB [Bacteroidota bacterium]
MTDQDVYLFREGRHFRLYQELGAHAGERKGKKGTWFRVWAPNARGVSVIGDFNGWVKDGQPMDPRTDGSGIWEAFIPGVGDGAVYKYHVRSLYHGYEADKGDPFATRWEEPPRTGSVVWDLDYAWGDAVWMRDRHAVNALHAPASIYEVHLGSWRRVPEEGNRSLTYRELAPMLASYMQEMGFTHVEFLPVMEHPFYGSWGYQTTGYFAPSSRFGSPQDFMYLVDVLHQHGIGVILDWVPSHFPGDEHGLAYFDGTHLFEHMDPRQGYHPDWKSYIYNYGRNEVRAYLISSALFWLDRFHVDGLRVDAVASMLYLNYSRADGDWVANIHGGKENLEAIAFLKQLNEAVYQFYPDVQTTAEESTDWAMVSRPVYVGGLGFGMKWNMGWMHDTLFYISKDPLYRKYHHDQLTFSIWYAFFENFVLSISHDEVTHGKGSLAGKMPGDEWQKNANLRLLYGYMFGHPGKKLLFMGCELGQWREWSHEESVEWHVLEYPSHRGIQRWVRDLNTLYRSAPELHELDFSQDGFSWVDFHDWENSIISFLRKDRNGRPMLVVCNFTPAVLDQYRLGVPVAGFWKEVLNSDSEVYGGSNVGNFGGVWTEPWPSHGHGQSLRLVIPPLGAVFLSPQPAEGE